MDKRLLYFLGVIAVIVGGYMVMQALYASDLEYGAKGGVLAVIGFFAARFNKKTSK